MIENIRFTPGQGHAGACGETFSVLVSQSSCFSSGHFLPAGNLCAGSPGSLFGRRAVEIHQSHYIVLSLCRSSCMLLQLPSPCFAGHKQRPRRAEHALAANPDVKEYTAERIQGATWWQLLSAPENQAARSSGTCSIPADCPEGRDLINDHRNTAHRKR